MNPKPTDHEIAAAGRVLARAADADAEQGQAPMVLIEYGEPFAEKYLFIRLDHLRLTAGAMGFPLGREGQG